MRQLISTFAMGETHDDLENSVVFPRCLNAFNVPNKDREMLTASYDGKDVNAE